MKKIKLLGIGKSEHHNYYIFPKEQIIFSLVRTLVQQLALGENDTAVEDVNFGLKYDKKLRRYTTKEEKIKPYKDSMAQFHVGQFMIKVIFGDKKVFLFIDTKEDRQQEISKILSGFFKAK